MVEILKKQNRKNKTENKQVDVNCLKYWIDYFINNYSDLQITVSTDRGSTIIIDSDIHIDIDSNGDIKNVNFNEEHCLLFTDDTYGNNIRIPFYGVKDWEYKTETIEDDDTGQEMCDAQTLEINYYNGLNILVGNGIW